MEVYEGHWEEVKSVEAAGEIVGDMRVGDRIGTRVRVRARARPWERL